MIRLLLIVAGLAALHFAAPAQAQHWRDGELRETAVRVADLDLSTRAGVDELDRRIDRAVDRICGGDRDCREEAWASTWDQVDQAIGRDEWMRRLAAEREAQLRACRWQDCRPRQPAYYPPPPPPPPAYPAPATVVTVYVGYPAPQVQVYSYGPR